MTAEDTRGRRAAEREDAEGGSRFDRFARKMRELYFGNTPASRRFRFGMLTFDIVAITYFVVTTVTETAEVTQVVDFVIGCILLADLLARLAITANPWRQLRRASFWVDVVVVVSLFGSAILSNLDFLRVLRILRILRSYRLLVELRRDFIWFRQQEEVIESAVNLVVFIFVTTSLVFIVEAETNPGIDNFLDALYFTIATLTTTGFGDITADGTWGRLLSVGIMVFGVGLFIRLLQALFRPNKVSYTCPRCGLERHDLDAVHCKHCGEIINIPTEGAV
jgi:voltage-gated potassium channel